MPTTTDAESGLASIANSAGVGSSDARLFGAFDYRPSLRPHQAVPSGILDAASNLFLRWQGDPTAPRARAAGAALLLAGRSVEATTLLTRALISATERMSLIEAIQHSDNSALLVDASAALLTRGVTRGDAKDVLLAFESADRACQFRPDAAALWNRAVAIERLGFFTLAIRAWRDAASASRGSSWEPAARARCDDARRLAAAAPPASEELFFMGDLISLAAAAVRQDTGAPSSFATLVEEGRKRQRLSGDWMASDFAEVVDRVRNGNATDRADLQSAMETFARGRAAVESDRLTKALSAFQESEKHFRALGSSMELLARDQRIRCECGLHGLSCLNGFRALHAELSVVGRYPWLLARTIYAEGQTLYRQGKIYEAAELFRNAQDGFRKTNDAAGVVLMDSLLANVLAVAGETDQALTHYLAGIRLPAPPIGDRRRRQLGDLTVFLLRHGFVSTTALVLDELDRWPATDEGKVKAATLRGVIHARRGEPIAAAVSFREAHTLLDHVADETVRTDAGNSLAVAEAGASAYVPSKSLAEIDAAIARHEKFTDSVLLPQLLVERGTLLESAGKANDALLDYGRAMELLEVRTPRIDRMLMGFGIDSQRESPFDRAIRLLLAQKRFIEALTVTERARGLRISALYSSAAGLPDSFRSPDQATAPLSDVRSLLGPVDVVVVQHLLRDEIATWLVTAAGVDVARLPVDADSLIADVKHLQECVPRRSCGGEQLQEHVSDVHLRGWIDRVPRGATLILIPPADLNSVPFPMLTTRDGEPLLLRNVIVTELGLREYARAERADASRRGPIAALFAAAPRPEGGRAPLPFAANEVVAAARAYRSAVVDTHATRQSFLAQAASASVIHFAGHGVVNTLQPLLSALVFEPGDPQMLYIHEVDGTTFPNARLMVLSACETGATPQPGMSIAHALLNQGVPSVVYTSWPVADDAAKEFAVEFHRHLAGGASRAVALHETEITLFRKQPLRKEMWAAFAISGAFGRLTE